MAQYILHEFLPIFRSVENGNLMFGQLATLFDQPLKLHQRRF